MACHQCIVELPPPYSENEQVYAHSSKQETGIVERTEDLPELRVYTRRWYILALFCGMACHQSGIPGVPLRVGPSLLLTGASQLWQCLPIGEPSCSFSLLFLCPR